MNANQGLVVDSADPSRLAQALELALDYRGDVTLVLRSGRTIEGYVYDRRHKPTPAIRVLVKDSEERVLIPDGELQRVEFSGKDTAAGKTFENWIRRYAEQKRRGELAGIESESLDPPDSRHPT